jgi:hypothetical protein
LHIDDPWRRLVIRDAQGNPEGLGHDPRFVLLGFGFVLFTLIVDIPEYSQTALQLVLEECVMEHLVIDVYLTEFWVHTLPQLLSHHLLTVALGKGVPKFADTRGFDILRQFEHGFENTPFGLQEFR